MSKFLVNVSYLEEMDVNDDGSLKDYVGNGKPVLLMVQGNFCGYCTKAKPDFQKLKDNPGFTIATVQTDGSPSESKANSKISKVMQSKGVPAFGAFDKNGKFVAMHSGGRDSNSLVEFMKNK